MAEAVTGYALDYLRITEIFGDEFRKIKNIVEVEKAELRAQIAQLKYQQQQQQQDGQLTSVPIRQVEICVRIDDLNSQQQQNGQLTIVPIPKVETCGRIDDLNSQQQQQNGQLIIVPIPKVEKCVPVDDLNKTAERILPSSLLYPEKLDSPIIIDEETDVVKETNEVIPTKLPKDQNAISSLFYPDFIIQRSASANKKLVKVKKFVAVDARTDRSTSPKLIKHKSVPKNMSIDDQQKAVKKKQKTIKGNHKQKELEKHTLWPSSDGTNPSSANSTHISSTIHRFRSSKPKSAAKSVQPILGPNEFVLKRKGSTSTIPLIRKTVDPNSSSNLLSKILSGMNKTLK